MQVFRIGALDGYRLLVVGKQSRMMHQIMENFV